MKTKKSDSVRRLVPFLRHESAFSRMRPYPLFMTSLVVGTLALALLLVQPIARVSLHVPLNYNEGWNAYLAIRAVSADPAAALYPGPGSLVFNNYPPLSFFVVGLLGRLTGDMIVAGRIVALLAQAASILLVGCCVRRMGGCRSAAVAAGLLMALYTATSFQAYTGIDDPQWLAHALMLAGLACLLGGPRRLKTPRVVTAALLVVAGGFVKHNLVALPLAITIWLAIFDRRACIVWCVSGMLGAGLGFGLSFAAFGPDFLTDLLEHERLMTPVRIMQGVRKLVEILPLLLIAALLWYGRGRNGTGGDVAVRRYVVLVTLFVAIALVLGLIQRMGVGVSYNAQFETLIAGCLAAGLAMSCAITHPRPGSMPGLTALNVLAFAPLLVIVPLQLGAMVRDLGSLHAQQREWQDTIGWLRAVPGPVACETLAVCYWAGKAEVMDYFNLNQAMLVGRRAYPLADILHRKAVTAIELDTPAQHSSQDIATMGRDPLYTDLRASGYVPAYKSPGGTIFLVMPGYEKRPIPFF